MKEKKPIDYRIYGDGVVGPSQLDQIRADFAFVRELLHLSQRLSFFDRAKKIFSRTLNAAILAATLAATLAACQGNLTSVTPSEKSSTSAAVALTQTTSELEDRNLIKDRVRPSTSSQNQGAEAALNPESVALVRFTSKEEVAKRFGGDTYTLDPNHWELAEDNTAAVLLPDLSDNGGYPLSNPNLHWGIEHTIKTNGGVVQGYDKIKTTADGLETFQRDAVLNAQAVAEVIHPNVPEADVAKATIRVPANSADTEVLYRKILDDQRKLEAKQPGTPTQPENNCPATVAGPYTLQTIDPSKSAAAARWGADSYTSDPSHWIIVNQTNGDHYATFVADTSDPAHWGIEHKFKTAGAVVQTYNKIKRDKTGIEIGAPGPVVNNAQAEAKVIHPNVSESKGMAATFRIAVGGSTETDALWRDSVIKQSQAEVNQQPNTKTQPVNECPIPGGKSGPGPSTGSTPTPIPPILEGPYQRA